MSKINSYSKFSYFFHLQQEEGSDLLPFLALKSCAYSCAYVPIFDTSIKNNTIINGYNTDVN